MNDQEYQNYLQFIEDVLYKLTTIDDYVAVLESLDVQYNGKRFQGGCHNTLEGLNNAKYSVSFNKKDRIIYCHVCSKGYSLITFLESIYKARGENVSRMDCLKYICNECAIPFDFSSNKPTISKKYNWKKELSKYLPNGEEEKVLPLYDKDVLTRFKPLYYGRWLSYGISKETMLKYGIKWYDYRQQVIIPCFDSENILRGIRVRNTIENEYGKYMPLRLVNKQEYNFPTNLLFYGENHNFEQIKKTKKVWLVESEKSVMKFDTWFGDKNISLGLFGSNLGKKRLMKLLSLGINSATIMLDSDFKEVGDEEFIKFQKKVMKIVNQLKPYVPDIYVVYNNQKYNGYKFAPCDFTREQFNILMKNKEKIK